jgi:endonuclease YncB( thermonuclease family)
LSLGIAARGIKVSRAIRPAAGLIAALLAWTGVAAAQDAEPLVGTATVVDSDALRIGNASLMLWGIESVERPQTCAIAGQVWDCYAAAVRALQTITSVAEISCRPVAAPDPYGRILVVCFVGGVDVNEALVRAGFALAKRDETEDYVPAEDAARLEGIGLWQGEFMHPADFRRSHAIFTDRP